MSDLRKIFHPRVAMFMIAIPFMTLCPLAISSILIGFPFEAWHNNGVMEDYELAFEQVELPEDATQIGNTKTYFGGLDEQDKCDLVSAKLVSSKLALDDFSQAVQTNYQVLTNEEFEDDRVKGFKFLFNAGVDSVGLKVLPINKEENFIKADFESTDIKEDFGLNVNLIDIEDNVYVVYLGHLNAFTSRDFRCSK